MERIQHLRPQSRRAVAALPRLAVGIVLGNDHTADLAPSLTSALQKPGWTPVRKEWTSQ